MHVADLLKRAFSCSEQVFGYQPQTPILVRYHFG
jgi:hypothetical protein